MRNFGKALVFIMVFFVAINNARAVVYNISSKEALGVRLRLKLDEKEQDIEMFKFYSSDTNDYVYSMRPEVSSDIGIYTECEQISSLDIGLDYDDFLALSKFSLYGYNYGNHSSDRWYIATQYLIWEYIVNKKGGEIYFISDDESRINLYEDEIQGIKMAIKAETDYPSFVGKNSFELKINEEIKLEDTKKVLDRFNLFIYRDAVYKIEDNTFSFVAQDAGNYTFYCRIKNPDFKISSQVMVKDESVMLLRGNTNTDFQFVSFKVRNPYVSVTSKENKDFSGAVYAVYDEFLNELGRIEFLGTKTDVFELNPGKYYLQLIEAPLNYEINKEMIEFEIVDDDKIMEVDLVPKMKKVVVDATGKKEGLEFLVLDAKSREVLDEGATNEEGIVSFDLAYGSYVIRVKDKNMGKNFNDILVTVDDNYDEDKTWTLVKKEFRGTLKLEKRDLDTKELILLPTKFKIKNSQTGEYLKINDDEVIVMNEGTLELVNLTSGDYVLEEIEAPMGYRALKNKIAFSLNEIEEVVNIVVYNEIEKGSLVIRKLNDKDENMANVMFNVYDKDKNILWSRQTNDEGLLELIDIPVGVYYVAENSNLEQLAQVQIKDNVKSIIKFRDEEILGSGTERIEIEVPATGRDEPLVGKVICLIFSGLGLIGVKKSY